MRIKNTNIIELLDVMRGVASWDELYLKLLNLKNDPKNSRAGILFEYFSKAWLLESGEYAHVYHSSEIPLELKRQIKIQTDYGIDLLAISTDKKLIGIQVKFKKDQTQHVNWTADRLSSLLAHRFVDRHVVIANCIGVDKITRVQAKDFQKLLLNDLYELGLNDFKGIIERLRGKQIEKKKFIPRSHQLTAVKNIINGFKDHSRGKLIIPCGGGKTYTALLLKEMIKPRRTLVLLPSLSLIRQVKNEWRKLRSLEFDYFCVCSECDVDSNSDHAMGSVDEIGFTGLGVTTNADEIKKNLKNNQNIVVFSTYQSSPEIALALKHTRIIFDLVICDEAHRTATTTRGPFVTIHDDKKIPAKKRLYMTATPRIVSSRLRQEFDGKRMDITKYLADMGDEKVFGPELFRMSFKEAIERKLLVDYKILAVGVTDKDIKDEIMKGTFTKKQNFEDVINHYALREVMKLHDIKHAITFHSRVKWAKDFSDFHKNIEDSAYIDHISGKQSSAERHAILEQFRQCDLGIISNAKCLTEGIDMPSVDCVFFCDPKSSKIDIVQASGRALRLSKGKKTGYIVVPIYHMNKSSLEEEIETGRFNMLVSVIRAMSDQDARLEEEITQIIWGARKHKSIKKRELIDTGKVEKGFLEFPNISERLKEKIFFQVIRKSLVSQWRPFIEARKFAISLKLKSETEWRQYCRGKLKHKLILPADIPCSPAQIYREKGWIGFGDWLGTGRIASRLIEYREFTAARSFARSLKLNTNIEWRRYCKGELIGKPALPPDIPANPNQTYSKSGWIGFGDWLGTGRIASKDIIYRPFHEAREFVRSLHLTRQAKWVQYCRGELDGLQKLPDDIPAHPNQTYKNDGWVNFGDWLGTGRIANFERKYRSFIRARAWARTCGARNAEEWRTLAKNRKIPYDIPLKPERFFLGKGWISFGDWLGTGAVAFGKQKRLSFNKARAFVRKLQLKNSKQWKIYCKGELNISPSLPDSIPVNPDRYYEEWINWGDWLGNGNLNSRHRKFLSFAHAREFVRTLNLKHMEDWNLYKKGKLPDKGPFPKDIPRAPNEFYKSEWISFGDWFGTHRIANQFKKAGKINDDG